MNAQTPSENELLRLAHRLDSIALAQIYDLYSPDIYRYAMRLLGNTTLAEDCVSETFSRLLQALASGKGPRDYLRAYLYRIAHNWITDQYRRERPTEALNESLPSETSGLEEIADQNMQHSRLLQAIRKLTPDQQQVIALKFWQDWENEEIARTLGKPVGAIKSLQHRALNTLQRHLQELGKHEHK
jgi:RNA polymerase sigma-70 factor, ECF subfamily